MTALANKDKGSLAKLIYSKAQGDLANIREGDIDENNLVKLVTSYGKLNVQKVAAVTRGDERVVVLGTGQHIEQPKKGATSSTVLKQMTLHKEDGRWKVLKRSE